MVQEIFKCEICKKEFELYLNAECCEITHGKEPDEDKRIFEE